MNKIFKLKSIFAIMIASFSIISCSDLTIVETDSVIQATPVFSGVEDVDGQLTSVYRNTYGMIGEQGNWFAMNEVSTDELLVQLEEPIGVTMVYGDNCITILGNKITRSY